MHRRLQQLQHELLHAPSGRAFLASAAVTGAGAVFRRPFGSAVLTGVAVGSIVREIVRSQARLEREARNAQDAALLAAQLGEHSPPLGVWAIEADFGELIMRELYAGGETVVELGSGVSTLLISGFLSRAGRGRLLSVDHDLGFLTQSRAAVELAGVAGRVNFVHAPLRAQQFAGITVSWYDAPQIVDALDGNAADLVVVDGPPSVTELSRWPVLAALGEHIGANGTVLLDDGRAKRETAIAQRWADEHRDFELYWHDTVKGSWRLKRNPTDEAQSTRVLRSAFRALNPHPSGFGRWGIRRA